MLAAIRNVFLSMEYMVIHRPLIVLAIVAVVVTIALVTRERQS
jgi:hypothetical protein